jgi:[ribosomal protein S18]-alanine N-acetyltransferase
MPGLEHGGIALLRGNPTRAMEEPVHEFVFEIRRLGRDELPAAYILCQHCFPGTYGWDTFLTYRARARDGFFLLEADGVLEGFLITRYPLLARLFGGVGEIVLVGVARETRRRGLGTALVEHALEFLRGKGVREVRLHVDVDNAPAIALYERLGMRKLYRVTRYYRTGADAWRMGIDL